MMLHCCNYVYRQHGGGNYCTQNNGTVNPSINRHYLYSPQLNIKKQIKIL